MDIKVGDRFQSFAEFENVFRRFQVTTNTLFVKKTSKSVDVVNAHLSLASAKLEKKLEFANATYTCKHGGPRRTTGTGIRPNQRTMKKDCPARIVIAARRSSQELEITSVMLEHNHDTTPEIFNSYPESRRFEDHEKEFVEPLLEMRVPPRLILQKLEETTGKTRIARDLHNLKNKGRKRDEADELIQVIEELQSTQQARIVPITDENQELQILFIQSSYMKKVFASFPEVLLVDATYRTNKLRMPLFVFVIEDGFGRSHVVAYAFVASEQQHVVTQLLQTFVKENEEAARTNVVVVDKDFTEINAVRETFPSKPAVHLCQFHVMKAFRSAAGQFSKSVEERERLLNSFSEMVNAPTAKLFKEVQEEFCRYANEDALNYFNKNWATIPHMWARHLCNATFTGGNNTTNRVESHNGKVKAILSTSQKLHEALRALLKISSAMWHDAKHQAALLQTCEFYTYGASSEMDRLFSKNLTPYACSLIKKEAEKLKKNNPEVQQLTPQYYHVASSCGNTWHKVCLDEQTCTCTTFSSLGLICRHFLAVCHKFEKTPDIQKAVKMRWFKSYQIAFMAESSDLAADQESPSEIVPVEPLTMPGPSYAKMNRNQRFNYAMRTLKAMADHLADCPADIFSMRLELLEEVHESWLKGEEVVLNADTMRTQTVPLTVAADADEANAAIDDEDGESTTCLNEVAAEGTPSEELCRTSIQTEHDVPVAESAANQTVLPLKLPVVKCRGRPKKNIGQKIYKKTRGPTSTASVPFEQLPEASKHKLLLTGIVGETVCNSVLIRGHIVDESEVEVRPDVLPSALLDYRVKLPSLKKFFTEDAWTSLMSSVATKKKNELWFCHSCKEKDDGQIKMISCDQCLEWFHWSCVGVRSADAKLKRWFCCACKLK
ncbi:uncharacterized protein LOC119389173 [Rhipicephalus sanguineus]|uniref:uncharacterized protein LOC119389173 n=1 Tax=Rhipicephalus sanguineus TaxID=34632 RepID=UPI0020C53539|nr:uncharacterized protein LOC119389173 [Rhipicephalus sanguineus]